MLVIGKIVSLDTEQVMIEPLEADADRNIPYDSRLEGISRLSFSKDSLDNQPFVVGDIVAVNYINEIQYGDLCWIDAVSWDLFESQ